jgi:hypothetical protein
VLPKSWQYSLHAMIEGRVPERYIPEADPEAHLERQRESLRSSPDNFYAIGPEVGHVPSLSIPITISVGKGPRSVFTLMPEGKLQASGVFGSARALLLRGMFA